MLLAREDGDETTTPAPEQTDDLVVSLPTGWCAMSRLTASQAFDGSSIGGMRFAGPLDEEPSSTYPTVEIAGLWNGELELNPTAIANGMSEAVDGDWNNWTATDVGGTRSLIRSNQDQDAPSETQLVTVVDDWAVSLHSYGLEEADLVDLADRLGSQVL